MKAGASFSDLGTYGCLPCQIRKNARVRPCVRVLFLVIFLERSPCALRAPATTLSYM
jgi:hypothetical protein